MCVETSLLLMDQVEFVIKKEEKEITVKVKLRERLYSNTTCSLKLEAGI